jgi:hypothetical protein
VRGRKEQRVEDRVMGGGKYRVREQREKRRRTSE